MSGRVSVKAELREPRLRQRRDFQEDAFDATNPKEHMPQDLLEVGRDDGEIEVAGARIGFW